jgi:hypothetical protein
MGQQRGAWLPPASGKLSGKATTTS